MREKIEDSIILLWCTVRLHVVFDYRKVQWYNLKDNYKVVTWKIDLMIW